MLHSFTRERQRNNVKTCTLVIITISFALKKGAGGGVQG